MRADDSAAFDRAWSQAVGIDQPVWLRHHEHEVAFATYAELRESLRQGAVTERLVDWVDTPTWEASRSLLDAHAAELVTDEAEAVLQTLVDEHPDAPKILAHLGLLALCRLDGIDAAYAVLDDPEHLRMALTIPPPAMTCRAPSCWPGLRAGLHSDDGDAHLGHALAALIAGAITEAERTIARCAQTSTSWERKARARYLADLVATRPDLADDLTRLHALLTRTTTTPG